MNKSELIQKLSDESGITFQTAEGVEQYKSSQEEGKNQSCQERGVCESMTSMFKS